MLWWMFQIWIPEARVLVTLQNSIVDFIVSSLYFFGWGYTIYSTSKIDFYDVFGFKKVCEI